MMEDLWQRLRDSDRKPEMLVAGIIAVVLLAVMVSGLLAWRDARVIRAHDAQLEGEAKGRTLEAERAADTNADARREQYQQNEAELADAQHTAEAKDPEGAGRAVGPATSAVADELRRQRQLRPPR